MILASSSFVDIRPAVMLFALVLSGAACSDKATVFAIAAEPNNPLASVQIDVCGGLHRTRKIDGEFKTSIRVNCEGAAFAVVTFLDGTTVRCEIAYVSYATRGTQLKANVSRTCNEAGINRSSTT